MRGIPVRKFVAAMVLLLVFGLLRLPVERGVEETPECVGIRPPLSTNLHR